MYLFKFLQVSHWSVHKKECERLQQQMKRANVLSDFPFQFTQEVQVFNRLTYLN